jgi:HK97 gp10 family phage protein
MAEINYYGKLFEADVPITPAIAKAANIAKTFASGLIKARTPVDTGKLKSSWKVGLEGGGLRIKNDTFYAGFVEFGTVNMAPRAMMTSSLPEIQSAYIDALYKEIGEAMGDDLLADYTRPGYSNAVDRNPKYPNVGSALQPKIKTGLSKKSAKTSKNYLFSDPNKILSKPQEKRIASARPLLQRRQR